MYSKSNIFGRDASGQRPASAPSATPSAGGAAKPVGATEANAGRPTVVSGRATSEAYKPTNRPDTADANQGSATAPDATQHASEDEAIGARLIVGPQVKLCGAEILNCDMLVVEGRVEATMDSRVLRIAEHGSFAGKVSIDVAEIYGDFEGELTARAQLIIHSTGRVRGKICYGKLVAEEGCELCGDINILSAKSANASAESAGSTGNVSGNASGNNNGASSSPGGNTSKDKTGKGAPSALGAS